MLMLKIYKTKCNCYYLTGKSSAKRRRKIVNDFENDKMAIISSARIFTEGVDCVCFVDNKMSVVDIIQ